MIDLKKLDKEDYEILFEPRFIIEKDEAHTNNSNTVFSLEAQSRINSLLEQPVPVLFGSYSDPYMNLDPCYIKCLNSKAEKALNKFITLLDEALDDLIMEQGNTIDLYMEEKHLSQI